MRKPHPTRLTLPLLRAILTALLVLLTLSPAARTDEMGRVLMFVRDGSRDLDLMLREEVGVMRHMLEQAGYQVDVATADGKPLTGTAMTLTPDITLAQVDVSSYAGVILPCMAPPPGASVSVDLLELLTDAINAGIPIAASRGSVGAVALAGGLVGHSYSYAGKVDLEERPEFTGSDYLGTGVTLDGNLATAGICPLAARSLGEPDGTVALTEAFITALAEAG